jgi:hypothetical protein
VQYRRKPKFCLKEPSRCGQAHVHALRFGFTRRLGWTFDANTVRRSGLRATAEKPQAPSRRPLGRQRAQSRDPAWTRAGRGFDRVAVSTLGTGRGWCVHGTPPSINAGDPARAGISPCIRPGVAVEEKSRSLRGFRARSTRITSVARYFIHRTTAAKFRNNFVDCLALLLLLPLEKPRR